MVNIMNKYLNRLKKEFKNVPDLTIKQIKLSPVDAESFIYNPIKV